MDCRTTNGFISSDPLNYTLAVKYLMNKINLCNVRYFISTLIKFSWAKNKSYSYFCNNPWIIWTQRVSNLRPTRKL